jgi:apolipoprotein N-acyltransferase
MPFINPPLYKKRSDLIYRRTSWDKDAEKIEVGLLSILLVIGGFLLSLTFAPYSLRFLAYISFIPFFWVISLVSSYKKVFWLGFLFGFVFFFFHLWWLYFLIVPVAPITKILLYLGVTILLAYLALYVAIFALATKYLGVFLGPFIWIVLEFLRTKTELGFPWGLVGVSQTPYIYFAQIASIFGVYGLSFWVLIVNLVIFYLLTKKKKLPYIIILTLLFLLPLGYGLKVVKKILPTDFSVALIQPNVHPNEKGDASSQKRLIQELISLVIQASNERPSLIILPETATLVDVTKNESLKITLQKIANEKRVTIFTGTPLYDYHTHSYYNGAVLFTPQTKSDTSLILDSSLTVAQVEFSCIYRKLHLVPFSERIPLIDKFPFMKYLETPDMGSCQPGKEYTIFTLPQTQNIKKFAGLICFEIIFPDLVRNFTRAGAEMLVNITNDGWFGNTPGPFEHCELAILRAVENGVPLLRCANNGISLIVDPYGRVLKQTPLFEKKILIGDVPSPIVKGTIYRQYGDILIYSALLIILLALVLKITQRR